MGEGEPCGAKSGGAIEEWLSALREDLVRMRGAEVDDERGAGAAVPVICSVLRRACG
jgi:hypothetical protein